MYPLDASAAGVSFIQVRRKMEHCETTATTVSTTVVQSVASSQDNAATVTKKSLYEILTLFALTHFTSLLMNPFLFCLVPSIQK